MANRLSQREIRNAKRVFERFDADSSGQIDLKELQQALTCLFNENQDPRVVRQMMTIIDRDGNGQCDFEEFLLMVSMSDREIDRHANAVQAFEALDTDRSGTITTDELRVALESQGIEMDEDEIRRCIDNADEDGDGVVDYHEFVRLMHNIK